MEWGEKGNHQERKYSGPQEKTPEPSSPWWKQWGISWKPPRETPKETKGHQGKPRETKGNQEKTKKKPRKNQRKPSCQFFGCFLSPRPRALGPRAAGDDVRAEAHRVAGAPEACGHRAARSASLGGAGGEVGAAKRLDRLGLGRGKGRQKEKRKNKK